MRALICLAVLLLAACAAQPRSAENAAYEAYWDCAFAAARPYAAEPTLTAHEGAMRAQAQCNRAYGRYQAAHEAYVRSQVRPDGYDVATSLAQHGALQKRRDVTRRLAAWITDLRG